MTKKKWYYSKKKNKHKTPLYDRFGLYSIDRVLSHTIDKPIAKLRKSLEERGLRWKHYLSIEFDGNPIKMYSQRYVLFKRKGIQCVKCSIKGKYFAMEKHRNDPSYHFNLYGIDNKGKEVMITKDHIKAKSRGGRNTQSNYQVMCSKCNEEKGAN